MERRNSVRGNIPLDVFYSSIDKSPRVFEAIKEMTSKDISVGGIQLEMKAGTDIPEKIGLRIIFSVDEVIRVTGQVMWEKINLVESTKSVGVQFLDIPPQDSQLITEHILLSTKQAQYSQFNN